MPNQEHVASLLGGKYRVLDRLGGGSSGDVHRGENTVTGRPVAIKILRADYAADKGLVSRFFQEAQAVNKIRHPNIVDVLDVGVTDDIAFLIMECLTGESAGSALARLGRLSFHAVVAIGVDVLDALDAAHRAGIVHRRLKPENVFLHRPMADVPVTVKLLDFGTARLHAKGATPRLHTPIPFGTTDYVSPEQAVGESTSDGSLSGRRNSLPSDGRSDIFSLGILLFELLTGKRPFRAPTAVATAYRVVHAPPPSFADVGAPAHPMLESIIAKALTKRPADRYPTAADFARELLRAVPDERQRAQALQEVLGDHSSGASGTLPSGRQASNAPRRSSAPPLSVVSARPSVSALRLNLSSMPPDFGVAKPAELVDGRSGSAPPPFSAAFPDSAPPPASSRLAASTALPLSGSVNAPRASVARERTTSMPPPVPVPNFCHVRGHVLRAVDHVILSAHGAAVRDRILARLPARYSDDFRHGSITGVVLYELEVFEAYAAAANAIVLGGDAHKWRDIGRRSVEGELASLMRPLSRTSDDAALFRRCTTIWSRLADFGTWKTERLGDDELVVRVSEFGPASATLRHWLIGVVEQTLRHAGNTATAVMNAGEAARTPDFELVVHLR
jgi:serine/threonine-protein kinase